MKALIPKIRLMGHCFGCFGGPGSTWNLQRRWLWDLTAAPPGAGKWSPSLLGALGQAAVLVDQSFGLQVGGGWTFKVPKILAPEIK